MAGEETVVGVKIVQAADLQAALQTVLKEMRPALIEIHAALLVDQGLQQLVLRFTNLDWNARCSHRSPFVSLRLITERPPSAGAGSSHPTAAVRLSAKSCSGQPK